MGPVYLYLDIITLLGPLLLSFDRRVAYWRNFPALFTAILPVSAFYIVWDHFFTEWGIWRFHSDYLVGISIWSLPIEEWLFFWVVPFACVFIYECWRCYTTPRIAGRHLRTFTWVLVGVLALVGLVCITRLYTAVTFILTAAALVWHLRRFGTRYLENIYIGWLICQLPFFLMNGVLTALPIVSYNDAENLGIRLYTIPIEDTFYGFLLYLMVISLMEPLRRKRLVMQARYTSLAREERRRQQA